MRINNREINKNNPPYIIAEMSANHNGNIDNAYKIIDMAKQCGANAGHQFCLRIKQGNISA